MIPQAYSTTSRPRTTSPRASSTVLPCSEAMVRARSFSCAVSSSRSRNITRVRRVSEESPQDSKALAAAATAASTSAGSAARTRACSAPVAGSRTGRVRVEAPVAAVPSIQCRMVFIGLP